MHNTSPAYKEQINKTVRNISYLKINFGIVNGDASKEHTITDNGAMFYSDSADANLGLPVTKRYLTFERNKFILDGKGLLPPESGSATPYYQGFVSNTVSDINGSFTTAPKITINFPIQLSFVGLTFRFNKIHNNFPSHFTIIGYNGATVKFNKTVNPTSFDFVLTDSIDDVTKIELRFDNMAVQYRRAELEYLMFGIVTTFTDQDLVTSTWERGINLMSTVLPKNNFNFTIMDIDRNYNPENPSGVWKYLENRQPVWFEYGYELDSGEIEWISGSNLYSNGEVTVDSSGMISNVNFKTSSIITSLEEEYYRGSYNPSGISLYDLALDVLDFADLPLIAGGVLPYVLDPILHTIITKVPMPTLPISECLQLIANAGRCVLSINRVGQIQIQRYESVQTNFKFDYTNMMTSPALSKSPYLLQVNTFSHTVSVSAETSQVHTSNVNLPVATECLLKYDMSTETSLSVGGGVSVVGSPEFFAGSCLVTLVGTGSVTILGKKLIFSKESVNFNVNPNGFICPVENMLLNSPADALAYAQWVASVLVRRNTYKVDERGYPDIDTGDLITMDTPFSEDMEAIVISNKLTYNGALSGETTFLANEVT